MERKYHRVNNNHLPESHSHAFLAFTGRNWIGLQTCHPLRWVTDSWEQVSKKGSKEILRDRSVFGSNKVSIYREEDLFINHDSFITKSWRLWPDSMQMHPRSNHSIVQWTKPVWFHLNHREGVRFTEGVTKLTAAIKKTTWRAQIVWPLMFAVCVTFSCIMWPVILVMLTCGPSTSPSYVLSSSSSSNLPLIGCEAPCNHPSSLPSCRCPWCWIELAHQSFFLKV